LKSTPPTFPLSPDPTEELAGLDATPHRAVGRFTAINLAGSLVPLIVAVITVPEYLHVFGEVRYGIWLVAWGVVGYFGLLDLGLGRATANSVAKRTAASAREREEIVWTGVAVNAGFGIVVGVLTLVGGEAAVRVSSGVGGHFHSELVAAVPWLAVTVPLFIVTTVLIGALEGLERFLIVNVVGTLGGVLVQSLPLAAGLLFAPRLNVLAAATALALFLSTGLAMLACVVYFPLTLRPTFARTQARGLLRFGAWITVTSLISPLMSTLDKLIIGVVSGARAVTHYTVPFNLVTRLWILPVALTRSVFPRFSRLKGPDALLLADELTRALIAVTTPIVVVAMLGVGPFMRAWVGHGFASAATLPAEILLLGFWVNSIGFVPYTLLQAQGRPDLPAKLHSLELLPFIAAIWLGVRLGGVAGAATAWSGRVLVDSVLLLVVARFEMRRQRYLALGAAFTVTAFALAQVLPQNVSTHALAGLVLVPAALVWSWRVAPPSLRHNALRLWPRERIAST
jgi:O-antigen/teichoic acid export membrane protein